MKTNFNFPKEKISGEFYDDKLHKILYATDASVYHELPAGVFIPKDVNDLKLAIDFVNKNKLSLIPRATGTSLAGQCVGSGIVLDITKYFNNIIELNAKEKWVRVQPGVIRDKLNDHLKPYGLFFAPITSTSNRATVGGMTGNNSCGANSIKYGSVRDKIIEAKVLLSDGSEAVFKQLTKKEYQEKLKLNNLEGEVYRKINDVLNRSEIKKAIKKEFPKKNIHRRNMGYALDILFKSNVFNPLEKDKFNFAKLLCGSEGTLALFTELKFKLDPLPEKENCLIAFHFKSLSSSLKATELVMKYKPTACELMDKIILDCAKTNIKQRESLKFISGSPAAILIVEVRASNKKDLASKTKKIIERIEKEKLSYAFPIIPSSNAKKIWDLRNAGLGVLANLPGSTKTVPCIEDTAVALEDLVSYIKDFGKLMKEYDQEPVYYAHAGAGELHLRPRLNLKKKKDIEIFFEINDRVAKLVKKYKGSLSGEHGDGRVRSPYIPFMLGETIYRVFQEIKKTWDENNIFNPKKIVDSPKRNTSFRYVDFAGEIKTKIDFSSGDTLLGMAEKCHGSGDCRKLPFSGGTMCPSYQATLNEKDTTRARANVLRDILITNKKKNPFNHPELKEVMDLCLGCKGCLSECPSNVDVASMKAEFLFHYYKDNPRPLRDLFFVNINSINDFVRRISGFRGINNFFLKNNFSSSLIKKVLKIAPDRDIPTLDQESLFHWYQKKYLKSIGKTSFAKRVYLFNDEFINHYGVGIGKKVIQLFNQLGYEVVMIRHHESGRTALSKGFLSRAKTLAEKNVTLFKDIINDESPLIGIEPSSILSFRDEYPRLLQGSLKEAALKLKKNVFLVEEFLEKRVKFEVKNFKKINQGKKKILIHGHCHQKALSSSSFIKNIFSQFENLEVEVIPSGCCGMAGSFGYEKEHYEVSEKVANLVLVPRLKDEITKPNTYVVASGISCREQIAHFLKVEKVHHFIELLADGQDS